MRVIFFFDRFCLKFICTNSTGGLQANKDSSPGLTPVFLSSHGQTEASALEPSRRPGHLCEPEPEPELEAELQPQPGPWFEPLALDFSQQRLRPLVIMITSMFHKLGVSNTGKSIELMTAVLWDLEQKVSPLVYEGLDSL